MFSVNEKLSVQDDSDLEKEDEPSDLKELKRLRAQFKAYRLIAINEEDREVNYENSVAGKEDLAKIKKIEQLHENDPDPKFKEYFAELEEERKADEEKARKFFKGLRRIEDPRISKYCEILGVPETASLEEIRAAHRKLGQVYHPDKGGDEEKMKEINNAYDSLIRFKK